jgi:hypothetical protein
MNDDPVRESSPWRLYWDLTPPEYRMDLIMHGMQRTDPERCAWAICGSYDRDEIGHIIVELTKVYEHFKRRETV